MSETGYSLVDRILHRLTLQCIPVAKVGFEADQMLIKTDPEDIRPRRHVFVAGLARAGTTVLMRKFHATGLYRSLTYRDMPFVLAPNLWRRLSHLSRRDSVSVERAHGDNVFIDFDSPESLDEVFWRVFAGKDYLKRDHLEPHSPRAEIIEQYVRYVNAILSGETSPDRRYLCKNNNNILRLESIRRAFPQALILVPFREPLQQAFSLLSQHRRFSELHKNDRFSMSYMTWLGHHEFGLDHRPFRFGSGETPDFPDDSLAYWLQIWCETYEYLERSKPEAAWFVCYEDLCTMNACWPRLAEAAHISAVSPAGEPFSLSRKHIDFDVGKHLAERAEGLYARLKETARSHYA